MRFFQSALLAVSALASVALAQSSTLFFTSVPTSATVGKSYTIEWKTPDTTTPITILLRKGPSGTLTTISTLTTTATGTTYTWIPDKSLADGSDYALQIIQGDQSNYNYSPQFTISGGSPSATSSVASASTSISASASASASTSASSSASASSVSKSVLSITTMTGNSTASAKSSVSAESTGKSNGTVSTATLSATIKVTSAASTGASGTQTAAQGAPTGAAGQLGSSPMALIFGAVAAMVYLN